MTSLKLHCQVDGKGPPAVLIHGFGQNIFSWRFLIPALASRHSVFAIDMKGHGQSPKPYDDKYALQDQAALILDFLREKGICRPTLIGHSMGGGVALLVALALQEGGTPPRRLVLIDSIAVPQGLPLFIKLLRLPGVAEIAAPLIPARWAVKYVLRLAYFDEDKIPPEAVEAYAAPLAQADARQAAIATARHIIPENVSEIVSQYSGLRVPTLIIWGRNDRITPLNVGERLSEILPNSSLRVVDGVGHIPHEEAPAEAIAIILKFVS